MGYPVVDKIENLCIEIRDKGEIGIIPYLEIGNINIKDKEYSFNTKASIKGCKLAKKDDVLISRVRPTRGAIITVKEEKLCVSNAFTVLRPIKPICSKIVWYFLAWNKNFLSHLGEKSTGSLYPTVNNNIILNYTIPLPPLGEQKRIVEKLDAILPKVISAKARLEKMPTILKKFRQSVLAAACSGRLTEDWREGKDLPEWKEKTIDQIKHPDQYSIGIGPFGSNLKVCDYRESGHPLVFVREIRSQTFSGINKKYVDAEKFKELKAHYVQSGELLITKMGAPPGDVAIYPENCEVAVITSDCIKLKVNEKIAFKKFIYYQMMGQNFRNNVLSISGGVAQQKVNLKNFKLITLSLPPLEEQHEIVCRIEKLFALADSLESKYKKAMESIEKIEQAVLAKAFRGELVPGDPNDEPAEELLKRILAEKRKFGSKAPKRKKKVMVY
jgi:type I restriction enzyme S subunit